MKLNEQIKQKREAMGLSQEDLAERIGISRQAVSKWEMGLSEPRGANKAALCEVLALEITEDEPHESQTRRNLLLPIAAFLLISVFIAFVLSFSRNTPEQAPQVLSVNFYDADANEVSHEALWYDTSKIETILIQWKGGTPDSVKMFFTPSGTETMEHTELLATKTVSDGLYACLISAKTLHRESLMGHLYFELTFAGGVILTTDDFNVVNGI